MIKKYIFKVVISKLYNLVYTWFGYDNFLKIVFEKKYCLRYNPAFNRGKKYALKMSHYY